MGQVFAAQDAAPSPTSWWARPLRARLGRLMGLSGAGIALGLLGNALHPAGLPLHQPVLAQAEMGQCSAAPAGPTVPGFATPQTVSPQEALALRGQPGLVIGDLRPPAQYARGHIIGAIHLPCSGTLGQLAFDRLPSGARLLLYDGDGRSAELQQAATTAVLRGISQIYLVQGGFLAWTLAGLPAESGTCERCDGADFKLPAAGSAGKGGTP